MRISPEQREAIREVVREVFGPGARVRLFGSRARDEARGGDIDLHVELPQAPPPGERLALESRAWLALQRRLGERRIDLVTHAPGEPDRPIDEIARATGIEL